MQKAFGKKSVIFMFLFPAFLIYTAFVIVSIVWAGYYSFFDWSGVGEKIFVCHTVERNTVSCVKSST